MSSIRVMSFNARMWTRDMNPKDYHYWRKRMKRMADVIRQENPDVILFQELVFPATLYIPREYLKAGFSISHHIYVKKNLKVKYRGWHMHWCNTMIEKDGHEYNIFSVHSHWDPNIYTKLMDQIRANIGGDTIIAGDWNVEPSITASLLDTLYIKDPNDNLPITFMNYNTGKTARLDYFACSHEYIKTWIINDFDMSDHCPVVLDYESAQNIFNPGFLIPGDDDTLDVLPEEDDYTFVEWDEDCSES